MYMSLTAYDNDYKNSDNDILENLATNLCTLF